MANEQIPDVGRLAGILGHDGTNWNKQGLLWAYYDRWVELLFVPTPATTGYVMDFAAVPANEVWVLEAISGQDASAVSADLYFQVVSSLGSMVLAQFVAPASGVYKTWEGKVTLKAGDKVRLIWDTSGATDDLYGQVWGHKMKLNL